jgi:tetratricopeptide (TPR) repeat protein
VSDLPRTTVSPAEDPEELIAGYVWRFDPETLREVLDEADVVLLNRVRAGLTARLAAARDHAVRARLLSLRASLARSLRDLDAALADGVSGLAHAEAAGDPRLLATVRVRLAHVYQWRGDFAAANTLFAAALAADVPSGARGSIHQHAGKCAFDEGRYAEAREHFERALALRRGGDPALVASTEIALAAVTRRAGG